MLFQMLSGVLPFRGDSMAELMYKIANEEAPDVRIIRKDIPERLANIVALALSKRSETRYQDGDQFAVDLRSVLAELSVAPASRSNSPGIQADVAKNVAFAAASAPAAGTDSSKTVVLGRRGAGTAFEATVVGMGVPPGYDATQKTIAGGAFAKTDVISRPGAPGSPAAGAEKTDPEA
jgi:serine/threonine-protein kinase